MDTPDTPDDLEHTSQTGFMIETPLPKGSHEHISEMAAVILKDLERSGVPPIVGITAMAVGIFRTVTATATVCGFAEPEDSESWGVLVDFRANAVRFYLNPPTPPEEGVTLIQNEVGQA